MLDLTMRPLFGWPAVPPGVVGCDRSCGAIRWSVPVRGGGYWILAGSAALAGRGRGQGFFFWAVVGGGAGQMGARAPVAGGGAGGAVGGGGGGGGLGGH